MCGICGFVKNDGIIEPDVIEKMLVPLEHRGPDDKGIFQDADASSSCILGHRRLSIIDLETGHQPLSDESGSISCVHNGEIYNFVELKACLIEKGYRFRTNSDGEVIANMYSEYGIDSLRDFNGMFAFAIWDRKDRSLFLARDRVGIKPLYYYFDGTNFLFSSSLKSFLALDFIGKEIDFEALSEYLQYLYINAPKTILKSIRKLEPGAFLVLKEGEITKERYWNMACIAANRDYIKDEKTCIDEIKSLLEDSVKKQLISDVPLGVFLSGGVDSGIITALAARHSPKRLKTFSVTFKERGYYDESKFARRISRMFGTEHREIEITPDLKSDLPMIVNFLDEPFADSSFVPAYYLSKFTREHVKVALSGTGGDDIFAGYRRYALDSAIEMFQRSPDFIKKVFSFAANNIFPERQSYIGEKALLAKRFFSAFNTEKENRHNAIMSFINKHMQKEVLESQTEAVALTEMVAEISKEFKDEPFINKSLYTDFLSYLSGDLLVKEDRATMAVGLEGRVPFLDHRLVEYSFRIEPHLKVKKFSTKYILKKAFEDILPRDILYREKHGFAFPVSEYLRGELREDAKDILFTATHDFFNKVAVEKLFVRHLDGKEDFGQHLWALMVFNLWYEKNLR